MIRVFGESLSVPWTAGPIVGNRPPLAPLPVSLSIRHSDELACGAGLLTRAACAHLRAGKPARESRSGTAALSAMATVAQGRTDPEALLAAVFNLDTARAARMLDASLRFEGVLDTWDDLIRPAFRQIEAEQGRGSACIEVEHALSWTVIRALQRIGVGAPASGATIILACTATEMHTLPLEALRAALAERGHDAVMLGADVPVDALVAAVARRGRRPSVVLWAQTVRTADLQTTNEVANRARLMLAGPGWPASQPGRRGRRVPSLQTAVERLTSSAVR
jgi:hypothetical protein